MQENLLTVDELAAKLQLPKSWVYQRTRQKGAERLPHLKCGRYCRFILPEVMEWLGKQQEDGTEVQ